jgi:hypothetical protein
MAGMTLFISYSRQDERLVNRLRADLGQAGATIWIDHEQLSPGTPDWEDAIRTGIAQAHAAIYVASPEARKSQYVRDEIAIARKTRKPVYPFWAAGGDWHDCVPLGWGATQYADGRGKRYGAGLRELIGVLAPAAQTLGVPGGRPLSPAPIWPLDPPVIDARQAEILQAQIEKLLQEVSAVGDGDLRVQAEVTPDTMGVLADSFNYMVEELAKVVGRVRATTLQVANAIRRLQDISSTVERQTQMIEGIAKAANERAQTREEVASAMNRITEITRQTYAAVRDANAGVMYLAQLAEQLDISVRDFHLPDQAGQGSPLPRS